jgi:lipoprotein-anchoring transpeptidase ErfK/SrfK
MSRRLIVALLVTGALSGLLVAVVIRPRLSGVMPSFGGKTTSATAPDPYVNVVAQAIGKQVAIYDTPSPTAAARTQLANPTEDGAPLVFLVRDQRTDWIEVLLPVRPNGSIGWIRSGEVRTSKHEYRIQVELTAHKITVFYKDGVFLEEPIGVGRGPTPTPIGVYYTKELLQPPNPNTAYGAYVYGISGYSNVLTDFAGGDGVVGIHGTNDPSTLGKDVSHGCIRMSNAGITRLTRSLPLGVPVVIQP